MYPYHVATGHTGLAPKAGSGTGALKIAACLVLVHLMAKRTPCWEGQTSSNVVCLVASNSAQDGGARLDTLRYPK